MRSFPEKNIQGCLSNNVLGNIPNRKAAKAFAGFVRPNCLKNAFRFMVIANNSAISFLLIIFPKNCECFSQRLAVTAI